MPDLTYKSTGVDVEAGDAFARAVGRMARGTHSAQVLSGIGGFAAAFAPDIADMEQPVLVSGTDGVGTKLRLAFSCDIHDTVGIDLVAMCINDILTTGARPIFFLDYFATGRLEEDKSLKVIEGIVEGCTQAGCALVGGETAELPGFYGDGEYDLAGFAVGIVDHPKIVDKNRCEAGDMLLGLPSSGLHSNGFSLVRRVIDERGIDLASRHEAFDRPVGEALLTPTAIYARPVMDLLAAVRVHAMAHITGGGIAGNVSRVLPEDLHPIIDRSAIPGNPVFDYIQGDDISDDEMLSVFNMGVGYVIVVAEKDTEETSGILTKAGVRPFPLGRLEDGPGGLEWR